MPENRFDSHAELAQADSLWQVGRFAEAMAVCRRILAVEPTNASAIAVLAVAGFDHDRNAGRTALLLIHALRLPSNRNLLVPMINRVVTHGLHGAIALYRQGRSAEADSVVQQLLAARDVLDPETMAKVNQLLLSRAPMERFIGRLKQRLAETALPRPLAAHCLVLLYGGIGDQIATLGFLAHLHARDGLPFIVVGTRNNQAMVTMYRGPQTSTTVLLEDPINPWGVLPLMRLAADHPFLAWIPLHFDREHFDAKSGATKMDFYRRALGVVPDVPVAAPVPDPQAVRRAEERFAALGVPCGRTVILAPHANTIGSLPDAWWIDAARHLRAAGFAVLVNGANNARSFDHHKNGAGGTLDGLDGIETHIPLDEMIPFTEMAGFFLGVRSGLCDLVAFAQARMVVLYPAERGADGRLIPAFGGCDGFESVRRCYQPLECVEYEVPLDAAFEPDLLAGWSGADDPARQS